MEGFPSTRPFGEVSCEQEMRYLGSEAYPQFFFDEAPFNDQALADDTYLIIGRRGSGKTSLAHFLAFQTKRPATTIDVDEPTIYEEVLGGLVSTSSINDDVAIARTVKLWECLIWHLVFKRLHIEVGTMPLRDTGNKWGLFVKEFLRGLLEKFLGNKEGSLIDRLEDCFASTEFKEAKEKAISLMKAEPIIVAVDTLERYSTVDNSLLIATAALIEAASNFNEACARTGLNVKVFMSGEIFPYLRNTVVRNTLKYIRNPLFLHWRPRDVVRLLSWRLYLYLSKHNDESARAIGDVQWDNHASVMAKVWRPFFGDRVENAVGIVEDVFPYLLRHTHMRPRQLIVMCNEISKRATEKRCFPRFGSEDILVSSVREVEIDLASEVLNSYATIYPNVDSIINALRAMPMTFSGSHLHKVSHQTKKFWPAGEYDQSRFTQLVCELGIVGRVRQEDASATYIQADFEYFMKDRLAIGDRDLCVIHPMFYEKLATDVSARKIVFPFPEHAEFEEVGYKRR